MFHRYLSTYAQCLTKCFWYVLIIFITKHGSIMSSCQLMFSMRVVIKYKRTHGTLSSMKYMNDKRHVN